MSIGEYIHFSEVEKSGKGCASVQNKIYKDDSVTKGYNQNSQKVYRKHILLF